MSTAYAYDTQTKRRLNPISASAGLILGGTALFMVVGLLMDGSHAWSDLFSNAAYTGAPTFGNLWQQILSGLRDSTLDPHYWAFIGILTALQWFWPARRDARALFSVEMAVDTVWFVMGNALQFTVVAFTLGVTGVAWQTIFHNWSFNLGLSAVGLSILAFIVADALAWVSHWYHHKVPTLWHFHAVHHSQQVLNALSDNRTHVGEVIFAALLVFIPSQILGLNLDAATGLAFIGLYYSAMLHSNIRTDLGPLRYIFMGPQQHRAHHSVLPQHFDTNFGTVFSWWDWMAGTMYRGFDEYPPTGITDKNFPLRERNDDANPTVWVTVFFKQLWYPFGNVLRSLSRPTRNVEAQPTLMQSLIGSAQHVDQPAVVPAYHPVQRHDQPAVVPAYHPVQRHDQPAVVPAYHPVQRHDAPTAPAFHPVHRRASPGAAGYFARPSMADAGPQQRRSEAVPGGWLIVSDNGLPAEAAPSVDLNGYRRDNHAAAVQKPLRPVHDPAVREAVSRYREQQLRSLANVEPYGSQYRP